MLETSARPNPYTRMMLVFTVWVLASLACSCGGISVSNNLATIDFNLTQAQIDRAFRSASAHTDNPNTNDFLLDTITGVELHDGFVRVLGTAAKPDGSKVAGSYDASLSAQDDRLQVKIVAVTIPGVEMNDARIVNANQKLAAELSRSVSETNGDVKFKEASVKEGGLTMKIEVNIKTK
jgi:hypothetical protein